MLTPTDSPMPYVIAFAQDAGTNWLVGFDLEAMRAQLKEQDAVELEVTDLDDVLTRQFAGMALLASL